MSSGAIFSGNLRYETEKGQTEEASKLIAEHGKHTQGVQGRGQQVLPLSEDRSNRGKRLGKADRTTDAVKNQVRAKLALQNREKGLLATPAGLFWAFSSFADV